MSMAEIIGRIGTIESMISELSRPLSTAAPAAAASGTSAANAAAFESALAAAGTDAGAGAGLLASSGLAGLAGPGGVTGLGGSTGLSGIAGTAGLAGNTGLTGISGPSGTAAASAPAAPGKATGTDVVATARKYIGVPYVWGGTNPATGMDCSGFVQRVFKDLGVELPRVVSDQMKVGTPVASLAEAKPGDLLVSFGGNHISIYLGNGKAIDAPVPGQTIQVRDAWEQQSNLTAIRRIVPAGQGA
ncbi:NlpC/P60 family protein [Pseudarthrobacter sp. AG30]|uniref:C40 family peptidase n=1 Tax=unclassified Pseudarthrobacter TaxID=2647000 RepID=UPI000D65A59D|nr:MULTISPECIES: C40 family peptidase [unclassified Pseudarthrobacter]RAX16982.1 NlpC/P60 family protein [Pseudarthrobacter sp. AG30]